MEASFEGEECFKGFCSVEEVYSLEEAVCFEWDYN